MGLPAAGKVHTDLLVNRSKTSPALAFSEVLVTGSLEVDIGTFAPYGETVVAEVIACLGVAASANAAYVYVTAGSLPNTRKINVQKSDFTTSATATLIRWAAVIGNRVGK